MLSWLSCCSETDQITAGFHHWLRVDGGLCHQQRHGHRQQRQAGLARYPWLLATYYLIIMYTIYSLIIYIYEDDDDDDKLHMVCDISHDTYIYDLREIVWTCVHMYVYVYVCVCVCMCMCMCIYMICAKSCEHVCICMTMYVCIYIYMYMYIYVYDIIIYSSFFLSFLIYLCDTSETWWTWCSCKHLLDCMSL